MQVIDAHPDLADALRGSEEVGGVQAEVTAGQSDRSVAQCSDGLRLKAAQNGCGADAAGHATGFDGGAAGVGAVSSQSEHTVLRFREADGAAAIGNHAVEGRIDAKAVFDGQSGISGHSARNRAVAGQRAHGHIEAVEVKNARFVHIERVAAQIVAQRGAAELVLEVRCEAGEAESAILHAEHGQAHCVRVQEIRRAAERERARACFGKIARGDAAGEAGGHCLTFTRIHDGFGEARACTRAEEHRGADVRASVAIEDEAAAREAHQRGAIRRRDVGDGAQGLDIDVASAGDVGSHDISHIAGSRGREGGDGGHRVLTNAVSSFVAGKVGVRIRDGEAHEYGRRRQNVSTRAGGVCRCSRTDDELLRDTEIRQSRRCDRECAVVHAVERTLTREGRGGRERAAGAQCDGRIGTVIDSRDAECLRGAGESKRAAVDGHAGGGERRAAGSCGGDDAAADA